MYRKAGRRQKARQSIFARDAAPRSLPNAITYSVAISACEKGQKPQQVLHLLQEMQRRGLLPNVITYSAAISAREWCQQPQQALHLLQEVQLRGLVPQRLR